MTRDNLGELEEQVLLVLFHLGDASAAAVADELSQRTGREVSPATTFMVMRRLEQRELVSSELETAGPVGPGRRRRLYRVVARSAVPLLRASRRARLALWTGLEERLK
jgi:DNA-binding PadR family transcriptional regulator